jgi:hypothetical protein
MDIFETQVDILKHFDDRALLVDRRNGIFTQNMTDSEKHVSVSWAIILTETKCLFTGFKKMVVGECSR